jgi:hypothetical protein
MEVCNLNPAFTVEEDIARIQIAVLQSEAVRKPKRKRNSDDCLRFRCRCPPRRV